VGHVRISMQCDGGRFAGVTSLRSAEGKMVQRYSQVLKIWAKLFLTRDKKAGLTEATPSDLQQFLKKERDLGN
jgi:hypothetical protein